jgi:DNA-binding XRE family transcriptional regulator
MKSNVHLSTSAYVRVHIGLTQQQLANSLGISRSTLALAETGRRPMPASAEPMLQDMLAIAKAMPAPSGVDKREGRNNRVSSQAALHTVGKKPFVTAQALSSTLSKQGVMTRYPSRIKEGPAFSMHLLGNTDCQDLLHECSIKQGRGQSQLAYLQLEARTAVTRGQELQAQLEYVTTMLQVNRDLIERFPFATGKRKLEHRNAKLHCRRLVLEDRLEHFDAPAMLLREYNINVMVQQLALLEQLITAVEKRKEAFNKQGMMHALPGQTAVWVDVHNEQGITGTTVAVVVASRAA